MDSIGFEKGFKVPIVIDGLNETQPIASVWHPELQYIINDIKKFDNVLIITTCRNAYLKPVFDKENVEDNSLFIKLEGFKENVEEAIGKYFKHYSITPLNSNFDKDLFNDPLFLRIFSQANKGNKSVEIDETSKYKAVDFYLNEVVESITTINRRVDPVQKRNILSGIRAFSSELWNSKSKRVEYKGGLGLLPIFDPNFDGGDYFSTITYKIIDEGLLFRNIHDGVEFAEFTHDLVGGYCIAKSVIFNNKKVEGIVSVLTSDDFIQKLVSEELTGRHPLAEDILKAIVYLTPKHTGKQLFELVDNHEAIKASLQVLRIIISTPEGIEALINAFKDISPESPILPHLLESLLDEVLRRNENIILADLLESVLLNLSSSQIDLNWSEVVRRKSNQITPYLYQTIELFESGKEDSEHIHSKLCFISLLLSSTNRYLRDMATKSLVTIGRKHPYALFDVFQKIERIQDVYILERILASICGVFLAVDNKELLFSVCEHLEKNYIESLRTSHILILDYIITLLDYAEKNFGYKRSLKWPIEDGLFEWQKDPGCVKEVTGDGKATWGFGPVEYDFAKYKIGSYLAQYKYEKDSKLPSLKEALAMVVWRIKELGYTKELFEKIDIALSNQEYEKYGYRGLYAAQRYGKKYRDIAFYELYGHNIIKGYSQDFKDKDGFRVSPNYIDPTFPSKPNKRQLITCCFLPKKAYDVQAWITEDNPHSLETHYIRADIEIDGKEWAMLYGHLVQEGVEKSRIDISVYTIMVPEAIVDIVSEKIESNELFMPYLVAENHYVFAGEIPWSDNYLDGFRHEDIDGDEVELYLPVSSYYQQTKSEVDIVSHAYMPSKKLAQSLGLRINLNDFNLYAENGEKVSSYLHDNLYTSRKIYSSNI